MQSSSSSTTRRIEAVKRLGDQDLLFPIPSLAPMGSNDLSEQEKVEYKRLRNRLAARVCRKRKLFIQQKLEKEVQSITKELTKSVASRYQLEVKLKQAEDENTMLRREVEQLHFQTKRLNNLLLEAGNHAKKRDVAKSSELSINNRTSAARVA